MNLEERVQYMLRLLPQLLEGLKITLLLFVITLVLSLPLGLLVRKSSNFRSAGL